MPTMTLSLSKCLRIVGTLTSLIALAVNVEAATRTWSGAQSAAWSLAANWQESQVPSPGDDLVFPAGLTNGGNLGGTNDLPAGTPFNSITFNGPGFNPTGNAITLGAGGIRVSSGDSAQLRMAITLNSAQAWTVDRDLGMLTISLTGGAVHLNGFALVLNTSTTTGTYRSPKPPGAP